MKRFTSLFLLLSLTLQLTSASIHACDEFWKEKIGIFRYPKALGTSAGSVPTHIQYGFESEYTLDRIDKIMGAYAPDESLGISLDAWKKMSDKERGDWFRANYKKVFPDFRTEGKLKKIATLGPEFDFLPERIIMDDTGNVEFVLDPMDTLEEWFAKVNFLNSKFGFGSMQGTVSTTMEALYHTSSKITKEQMNAGNLGFLNFTNDFDTLEKMFAGLERFREDQSKLVMRSFDHPWLGPMTKLKRDRLEIMLKQNGDGLMFDEKYMKKISKYANSFKFIGGTAYRPDIIYKKKRIVFEARDCHSDPKCLGDRLLRNSFFMQEGREVFANAANFPAFDSVNDFLKLSEKNQTMLRKLFPPKIEEHNAAEYVDEALLAVEVFRNFAYPLRNWSTHIEFLNNPGLKNSVAMAQGKYVARLNDVESRLSNGIINPVQAQAEIQGAVALFSEESKLYDAFKTKLRNIYGENYGSYYKPLAQKYIH